MSDPAAMRYWSTPPHTTLDETRQFLDQMIAAPTSESDDFLIEYRGEVIGKAAVIYRDTPPWARSSP